VVFWPRNEAAGRTRMKDQIKRFLKWGLTALSGGLGWAASRGWVEQGQAQALVDALGPALDPLAALLAAAAAHGMVLLVSWLKSWFSRRFGAGTSGQHGGRMLPVLLLAPAAGAFFLGGLSLLPSCAPLDQAEGRVFLLDEGSGAKGGLEVRPGGRPRFFGLVPIRDRSGKVIGRAEFDVPVERSAK